MAEVKGLKRRIAFGKVVASPEVDGSVPRPRPFVGVAEDSVAGSAPDADDVGGGTVAALVVDGVDLRQSRLQECRGVEGGR